MGPAVSLLIGGEGKPTMIYDGAAADGLRQTFLKTQQRALVQVFTPGRSPDSQFPEPHLKQPLQMIVLEISYF